MRNFIEATKRFNLKYRTKTVKLIDDKKIIHFARLSFKSFPVESSVPDPLHFGVDPIPTPDPRIHASD